MARAGHQLLADGAAWWNPKTGRPRSRKGSSGLVGVGTVGDFLEDRSQP